MGRQWKRSSWDFFFYRSTHSKVIIFAMFFGSHQTICLRLISQWACGKNLELGGSYFSNWIIELGGSWNNEFRWVWQIVRIGSRMVATVKCNFSFLAFSRIYLWFSNEIWFALMFSNALALLLSLFFRLLFMTGWFDFGRNVWREIANGAPLPP